MQLEKVGIHNFRSIKDLTCTLGRITTLLGPNNHGKSNVLAAVEFLLSAGMKLSKDDFCSGRPEGDNTLFVEATFMELTTQEKTTFRKYLHTNGSVRFRRWAVVADSGDVESGYRGYVEEPTLWWLQDSAAERLKNREAVAAEARDVPELTVLLEGGGRITKERIQEFQSAHIEGNRENLIFKETLEEGPLLGVKNIAGGVLPDFYLVPAVRDLGDETKTTGTATFSRLLQRAVSEMTMRDPKFVALQEQLAELVGELNERAAERQGEPSSELERLERTIKTELAPWGVDVSIRVAPPEVRKVLELGTELWIDDGHATVAQRKGHGLQRAIIFSLIRAWASVLRSTPAEGAPRPRAASETVVFAYEEPELFLHPHAQRTLSDSLRTIAATPEHQIVVCTHSTHFVDLENYRAIVIVHRPDTGTGTQVKQCTRDLFAGEGDEERKRRFHMASWVNPDRAELFFARKVVLVEGETEKSALPYLAEIFGCQDRRISVIDCGSKHNLPLYLEILNAFGIDYTVVHDEDPLPDPVPADWPEDKLREKRRTFALNANIGALVLPNLGTQEVVSPDFERFCGISLTQGERKGKPLAALDHFAATASGDHPLGLADLVRRVFTVPS